MRFPQWARLQAPARYGLRSGARLHGGAAAEGDDLVTGREQGGDGRAEPRVHSRLFGAGRHPIEPTAQARTETSGLSSGVVPAHSRLSR